MRVASDTGRRAPLDKFHPVQTGWRQSSAQKAEASRPRADRTSVRHPRHRRYSPLRPASRFGASALLAVLLSGSALHAGSPTESPTPTATLAAAPIVTTPALPTLPTPWTLQPIAPAPTPTPTPPAPAPTPAPAKPPAKKTKTAPKRKKPAKKTATNAGWTGYAFDTCSAPSQRVMTRWRQRSPFVGVGIYLGGVQRACGQHNLTRRWVRRQTKAGWKLLPLWVGPQASCTGFSHRIPSSPGPNRRYGLARADGTLQAKRVASAARRLGIGHGSLLFYDLESFDASRRGCVHSALSFLEAWTLQLHRRGYKSGVYSHINAGIQLLAHTPRSYHRPDASWYAWIDRANARPKEYIASRSFMRTQRVHQFALDKKVRFGGIRMAIDWNYVSFGRIAGKDPILKLGARGTAVRRLQKQLNAALPKKVPVDGSFGKATARAVKRFQARLGHARTSVVTPFTWKSLAHLLPAHR